METHENNYYINNNQQILIQAKLKSEATDAVFTSYTGVVASPEVIWYLYVVAGVNSSISSLYEYVVKYVILLRSTELTAGQFARILSLRDFEDGVYDIEIECAERNDLVIVYGYSDDLIELDGTIPAEGSCFEGGRFHLEQEKGLWRLKRGLGRCNNITALWNDSMAVNDDGERILWSYKTDIPHKKFIMNRCGEPYCEGFVFSEKDLNVWIAADFKIAEIWAKS